MAPSSITEDYYMVLGVEQNAAPQLIISSYRRLALKLHPDRNAKHDATEAFQRLGRAYETLNDETKRRAYDLIYPSITRTRPSPQSTRTSQPPPTSTSQSDTLREAAQVAALQKSKQERSARWRTKKNIFDSSIFELQRSIRRLEQEITNLVSISAAEAAEEAQKNSWGAWLSSPFSKKAEDSEEVKERKDRERQERRIEKDFKERRLDSFKADLKAQEDVLDIEQKVDTANWRDDEKIRVIQANIWLRDERERREREKQRQERERAERERQERERRERERQRQAREREERERQESERRERERQERATTEAFWKQHQEQWDKREREAAEASRKQQEKQRAAEQKRRATTNFQNRHVHSHSPQASAGHAYTPACRHDGWWPKVQGRTDCPTCYESWTYLLQCPSCMMKACPRCQAAVRPRFRTNPPRVRTPSPEFNSYYD